MELGVVLQRLAARVLSLRRTRRRRRTQASSPTHRYLEAYYQVLPKLAITPTLAYHRLPRPRTRRHLTSLNRPSQPFEPPSTSPLARRNQKRGSGRHRLFRCFLPFLPLLANQKPLPTDIHIARTHPIDHNMSNFQADPNSTKAPSRTHPRSRMCTHQATATPEHRARTAHIRLQTACTRRPRAGRTGCACSSSTMTRSRGSSWRAC